MVTAVVRRYGTGYIIDVPSEEVARLNLREGQSVTIEFHLLPSTGEAETGMRHEWACGEHTEALPDLPLSELPRTVIRLTPEDSRKLVEELLSPPKRNAALEETLAEYRRSASGR